MPLVEALIALITLTAMEIVLGIDNLVFIAILTDRLPAERRAAARRLGLAIALLSRVALLLALSWLNRMTHPIFEWTALGVSRELLPEDAPSFAEINAVSVRDLFLLAGGLFLLFKSVHEIHAKVEGSDRAVASAQPQSLGRVVTEIAVMDVVFSLDSVITAVGMARQLWVMIVAVLLAVGVMLTFANQVSGFIEKHPTLKMLALSFLLLIGVMLVAEAIGTHFNKGYIYFAMAFSLFVEFLNIRAVHKAAARQQAACTDD